jgi:hypothetical protein
MTDKVACSRCGGEGTVPGPCTAFMFGCDEIGVECKCSPPKPCPRCGGGVGLCLESGKVPAEPGVGR